MAMPLEDAALDFSPVRGDPPFRLQRALGLIPAQGFGIVRRALLGVLLTWVPLVAAAAWSHRLWPGEASEPLLQHFGVHVRFLLAVPLLIVGEAVAHAVARRVIPYFAQSGLITDADRPRFVAGVRRAAAWRDGGRPWLVIAALVIAVVALSPSGHDAHELSWVLADPGPNPALIFGTLWFRFVARPIFVALLFAWLWRLILMTLLMWRVSRLDLALVPTHPDRTGGLGFLEVLPLAFTPAAFAIAAVLAGRWGHDVIYHGVPLAAFAIPVGAFAVVTVLALLVPVLVFARPLGAGRRQAMLDYGALVGEQHRHVRRRWLFGEPLRNDPLLDAPELGPVADTISLYDAVTRMRAVPVSTRLLAGLALSVLLPVLPLVFVEIPLKDALLTVVRTLL